MKSKISAKITRIGNSQGVRLPKDLLEQTGIRNDVELIVERRSIIIRPAVKLRSNWAQKFQSMNKSKDDILLDGAVISEWDETEWTW